MCLWCGNQGDGIKHYPSWGGTGKDQDRDWQRSRMDLATIRTHMRRSGQAMVWRARVGMIVGCCATVTVDGAGPSLRCTRSRSLYP